MKRLFTIITVLLLAIGLSGCDLISEDIQDQISEELCVTDPDNELCNLDTLNDLEDSAILTLVEDLYIKYNDEEVMDLCEQFISPSNPDLLEKCRTMEYELFPEDLTMFTPTEVTKDGDSYIITGEHNFEMKEFKIMITVVEVEGSFLIETYSYTLTDKEEPMPEELDQDKAFAFYKDFFMKFGDQNIPNEDFCLMFYDGIDEDCDDIRDDFFMDFTGVVEVEPMEFMDAKVHGHVTVLKAMDETETFELELMLMMKDDGTIFATEMMVKGEDNPLHEEATMEFNNMLYDYFNPNVSDDEFFEKYMWANHNTTRNTRMMDLEDAMYFYPLYTTFEVDDEVVLQVMNKDGSMESRLLKTNYMEEGTTFKFEFEFIEPEIIMDELEAKAVIDSFFDVFTDASYTDDDFFMKYYGSGMHLEFIMNREMYKDYNVTITRFVSVDEELGIYGVTIQLQGNDNTEPIHWVLDVRVNRWEAKMAVDINGVDDDCDDTCDDSYARDDVIMVYEEYLQYYLSPEITDDELTEMYFEYRMDQTFYDIRKEVQDIKQRSLYDVVGPYPDGSYIILLLETEGENMRLVKDKIKVGKRIDQATPLLMILDEDSDDDNIPIDEKLAFLDHYANELNHMSIIAEDMCMMFVPKHRIDSCVVDRMLNNEMGYVVDGIDLFNDNMGNAFIRIRKRPDLLTQEWDAILDEKIVFFYHDPNGMLLMEAVQPLYPMYDQILVDEFTMFLQMAQDRTLPPDEVCMYVSEESMDTCHQLVTMLETDYILVELLSIENRNGLDIATLEFMDVDEMTYLMEYQIGFTNHFDHNKNTLFIFSLPS